MIGPILGCIHSLLADLKQCSQSISRIRTINDIMTTKQRRNYVTACVTPTDQMPTRPDQPALASISALRNRSISSIKPTEGTSSTSAVIARSDHFRRDWP